MILDIDHLEALAKAAPQGKWEIWTSNSWRRIYADQGREKVRVIEPTTQHDRWPDLAFGPGVEAWMEGFTPEVALALIAEVRALREESARLDFMLANDAFTVRCNRDGSILQYQLMTQDEDENYHVLHDEHRFYNTERDAIDAARKEKA